MGNCFQMSCPNLFDNGDLLEGDLFPYKGRAVLTGWLPIPWTIRILPVNTLMWKKSHAQADYILAPPFSNFSIVTPNYPFLALTSISGVTQENIIRNFTQDSWPQGGFIISTGNEMPRFHLSYHWRIKSVRVLVADEPETDLAVFFDRVTEMIQKAKIANQWAIVHCREGVSRSASFVLAWMIRFGGLSLEQSFFALRLRRPIIRPNWGFMAQLLQYEKKIIGSYRTAVEPLNINGERVMMPKFLRQVKSTHYAQLVL